MQTGFEPDSVRSRPGSRGGASCSSPLEWPEAPAVESPPESAPDRGASCGASSARLSGVALNGVSRRPRVSGDDGTGVVANGACRRPRVALLLKPTTCTRGLESWLTVGCALNAGAPAPDRPSIASGDAVESPCPAAAHFLRGGAHLGDEDGGRALLRQACLRHHRHSVRAMVSRRFRAGPCCFRRLQQVPPPAWGARTASSGRPG